MINNDDDLNIIENGKVNYVKYAQLCRKLNQMRSMLAGGQPLNVMSEKYVINNTLTDDGRSLLIAYELIKDYHPDALYQAGVIEEKVIDNTTFVQNMSMMLCILTLVLSAGSVAYFVLKSDLPLNLTLPIIIPLAVLIMIALIVCAAVSPILANCITPDALKDSDIHNIKIIDLEDLNPLIEQLTKFADANPTNNPKSSTKNKNYEVKTDESEPNSQSKNLFALFNALLRSNKSNTEVNEKTQLIPL